MSFDIKKTTSDDGTIDADYAWGRPVSTYLSTLQHLRLLLLKARLGATDPTAPRPRVFRPC
jgi:hypothetical protein